MVASGTRESISSENPVDLSFIRVGVGRDRTSGDVRNYFVDILLANEYFLHFKL